MARSSLAFCETAVSGGLPFRTIGAKGSRARGPGPTLPRTRRKRVQIRLVGRRRLAERRLKRDDHLQAKPLISSQRREDMSRLGLRYRAQRQVVTEYQETINGNDHQLDVRRHLVIGLIGAVRAIFGGVNREAYHEFGDRSLRNFPPLVLADRTPLKLLPGEVEQEDTSPPDRTRSEQSDALAPGPGDPASPDSQIVLP